MYAITSLIRLAITLVTAFALVTLAIAQPVPTNDSNALKAKAQASLATLSGRLEILGLKQPVTVLRDRWGVPHIYATNRDDLFFAQGFVAAQDRLFQMELWKRDGQGRLAEILGPSAVDRDTVSRLICYRGDMKKEWESYSPDTKAIAIAFTRGINAFLSTHKDRLPVEFSVAGFTPEPWQPEDILHRNETWNMSTAKDVSNALIRAQFVHAVGPERTTVMGNDDPLVPLSKPEGVDLSVFDQATVTRITTLARLPNSPIRFAPEPVRSALQTYLPSDELPLAGSNNWVVSGIKTRTGKPLLANDPHRLISLPSNRYLVHLSCPGWNVIGANYPHLPGVQIGHNEKVAWGLTIVNIVNSDLIVEETDPKDADRYRTGDNSWAKMTVITEQIRVKGEKEPRTVSLRYTRNGPVLYADPARRVAFAVRWIGSEPGTAPYLAALALDRATDAASFRKALARWKAPDENFVYADTTGNIGWQVTGLAPLRRVGMGKLPLAGPKREGGNQTGYLPFDKLPHSENPASGFLATANNNNLPPDYPYPFPGMFSPSYRFERIREVLSPARGMTVEDFATLQNDHLQRFSLEIIATLPKESEVPSTLQPAITLLRNWDGRMEPDSPAAALVNVWFIRLTSATTKATRPAETSGILPPTIIAPRLLVRLLMQPTEADWGPDPTAKRDRAVQDSLKQAWETLIKRQPDPTTWTLGVVNEVPFLHPLSSLIPGTFDLPSIPHGGGPYTVDVSTIGPNGGSGASYREILDMGDWDNSRAVNTPGQSGQPFSPHYADLLPLWAEGKYFPLLYSRPKVEAATLNRLELKPVASVKP